MYNVTGIYHYAVMNPEMHHMLVELGGAALVAAVTSLGERPSKLISCQELTMLFEMMSRRVGHSIFWHSSCSLMRQYFRTGLSSPNIRA